MNTQKVTYAIRNLALGTERRTTSLPSCWNWISYLPFPGFFTTLGRTVAP